MRTVIVSVIACCVGAGAAKAQDWVEVAQAPELAVGFNRATMTVVGDRRTVSVATAYRTRQSNGADYFVADQIIDCRSNTATWLTVAFYSLDTTTPLRVFNPNEVRAPAPGGVGAISQEAICGRGPFKETGQASAHDFAAWVRRR